MSNPFDKESLSQREKDILQDGGWQCSFCATVNASYITTCSCSHNRDDSYENLHGRYVPREDEEWTEAGITVEGPAQAMSVQEPTPVPTVTEPAFQPAQPVAEEPAFQPAQPVAEEPAFQPAQPTAEELTSSATAFEPETPVSAPAAPVMEPAAPPVTEEQESAAIPKAPVSNTNRPMEEYSEYEQGILRDGGWECAFCSRINANYITTCACGHSTDDSYLKRRGRYVDPDGEEQEEETLAKPASAVQPQSASTPAASASPQQNAAPTEKPASEKSGADMIAEIEQELKKNNTPAAKLRAIRKFKDLNKKGFMSAEELNRRMDELMGFDDDEGEAENLEESTDSTEVKNNDNAEKEDEIELL